MFMRKILMIVFGMTLLVSCNKTSTSTVTCPYTESTLVAPAGEIAVVQAYVTANAPAAVQHSSGIFYEVTSAGTGTVTPGLCSYLTVKYTGKLFNNTIFDQNLFGTTFQLGNLIVGWQKGIPQIKKGGTIRLFVPPSLGYGASGSGSSVPPNAYLIFDIQLLDVQ